MIVAVCSPRTVISVDEGVVVALLYEKNKVFHPSNCEQSFRLAASYFLCWCKENNQRKHLLVKSTTLRGCAVLSPFSDSPSMARSENGRHPCRPPSGCPDMQMHVEWGRGQRPEQTCRGRAVSNDLSTLLRLTFAALQLPSQSETPKGRRPWMAAGFGSSHGWRVRNFPRHLTLLERG